MVCGVWTTTDVPANKVGRVKAGYQLDAPESLDVVEQPNGKFTVTATFPPCVPDDAPERMRAYSPNP